MFLNHEKIYLSNVRFIYPTREDLHVEFKIEGLVEIEGISIKVQFLVKKIQVFIKQTKK